MDAPPPPSLTFFPSVLLHGLHDDDEEQREEVETLAHVAARHLQTKKDKKKSENEERRGPFSHLKEVVLVELLEDGALQLDELEGGDSAVWFVIVERVFSSQNCTLRVQFDPLPDRDCNVSLAEGVTIISRRGDKS